MTENVKVVVIGDGAVGKSCLLLSYANNSFPDDYVPTVFDNYNATVLIRGKHVSLGLWDTAGQEDYDRLRPLSYPETNVFLVCFSLVDPTSLENVSTKWVPEIEEYAPGVPKVLVGTKQDLYEDRQILRELRERDERPCTPEQIEKVRKDCKFYCYCETSAKTQKGLRVLFERAYDACISPEQMDGKKKGGGGGWFGGFFGGGGGGGGGKSKNKSGEAYIRRPQPPAMPPAGKAPAIDILPSTFSDDFKKLMKQELCHDCTLEFREGKSVPAHRIIMSVASNKFSRLFRGEKDLFSKDFIRSYETSAEGNDIVHFADSVRFEEFEFILEYLYSGYFTKEIKDEKQTIPNLKRLLKEMGDAGVKDHFDTFLGNLEQAKKNAQESDFYLAMNHSLQSYIMDQRSNTLKSDFYDQKIHSDLTFILSHAGDVEDVEDEEEEKAPKSSFDTDSDSDEENAGENEDDEDKKEINVHKCILSSRSEYFKTMLHSNFVEGTSKRVEIEERKDLLEEFEYFLQFLYTSHTHSFLRNDNALKVLVLCDKFQNQRFLSFCEVFVSKLVERECSQNIEKSDIDVIGILLFSDTHKAEQLKTFCLHFISSNFQCFKKREEEWRTLKRKENKELYKYVYDHQWPPLDYLRGIRQYEKEIKEYNKKTGKKIKFKRTFLFDDDDDDDDDDDFEKKKKKKKNDDNNITIDEEDESENSDKEEEEEAKKKKKETTKKKKNKGGGLFNLTSLFKFVGSKTEKKDVTDDLENFGVDD